MTVGAHVVHVTESLSGRTLAFLGGVLAELDALGVRQTLIFSRRCDTPAEVVSSFPPGVVLREIPPARHTHAAFIAALRRELRSAIADPALTAVHLHSSKAGFIGRLLLSMQPRRPLRCLYSPHGLAYLNPVRDRGRRLYWMLERLAGRLSFEPVGGVADEVAELHKLTGRPGFLLESSVPDIYFETIRRESSRPLVVSCGPVRPCRDPDAIVDLSIAFHIEDRDVDFTWIGAGDRDHEARLRASSVKVTGQLPDAKSALVLGKAWVYVQSSQWEDLPLSLYQAMAIGLPCVVTDRFGNRDTIRHGETGLIAGNAGELRRYVQLLLDDPALRIKLGRAARVDAFQRFGRPRFRAQLQKLYSLDGCMVQRTKKPPLAGAVAPGLGAFESTAIAGS